MSYSFHYLIKCAAITSLLGCYSYQTSAYVVLPENRIILKETEKTKSVQLINKSKNPHLIQLRIEPYSIEENTESEEQVNIKTPFFITPPIFILQGEQKQKVRVTLTSKVGLPKDRESIFSFNFLEISSDPAIQTSSTMKYTIDNSVKLFYRPSGIKGQVKDLAKSLVFDLQSSKLTIENKAGYYANFENMILVVGEKQISLKQQLVIAPFSKKELSLPKGQTFSHSQLKYKLINDYGGRDEYIAELTHGK